MPDRPTYLTVAEAAQLLGVNERTIRNWVASGRLPAYRVGTKSVRINEADAHALFVLIPPAGGAA